MKRTVFLWITVIGISTCQSHRPTADTATGTPMRKTSVGISGTKILINGEPTLKGVVWNGISMEGLLPNSRMVQGIFDDLNPATVNLWDYPDTHRWDPERNTSEFVAAMDEWKDYGLLGFTINLQGGSPQGYSADQPWYNSAIDSSGNLQAGYMDRLERIMNKADELGMVTILGIFYFGQDGRVDGEKAVKNAVRQTIDWLSSRKYTNVMIEIANECNNEAYKTPIVKADRIDELITLAQDYGKKKGFNVTPSVHLLTGIPSLR